MYMYANTHMYTALHTHVQYPPETCKVDMPNITQGRADFVRKVHIFVAVVGGEDVDTKGEQRLQGQEGQETDQVWSPDCRGTIVSCTRQSPRCVHA